MNTPNENKGRRNRRVIALVSTGLGILLYILSGGRWPLPAPAPEPPAIATNAPAR